MPEADGLSYRAAGVDLDAAERAKAGLKDLVARTRDQHTLSEMGLFGGLYAVPGGLRDPVLVSSADGVGTKLKVATLAANHILSAWPSANSVGGGFTCPSLSVSTNCLILSRSRASLSLLTIAPAPPSCAQLGNIVVRLVKPHT